MHNCQHFNWRTHDWVATTFLVVIVNFTQLQEIVLSPDPRHTQVVSPVFIPSKWRSFSEGHRCLVNRPGWVFSWPQLTASAVVFLLFGIVSRLQKIRIGGLKTVLAVLCWCCFLFLFSLLLTMCFFMLTYSLFWILEWTFRFMMTRGA